MKKKEINFKLLNIVIILAIVFLLYSLNPLISGILNTFFKVTGPFILAFILAYAIEPVLNFLIKKNIKKNIAILIIIIGLLSTISIVFALVLPVLLEQLTSLFNSIITLTKELIEKNNLNLGPIQETLNNSFNDIIKNFGGVVSSGALGIIDASLGLFTSVFIVFSSMIYFLIDLENIREKLKKIISKKSKKFSSYIELLDNQMKLYFVGFFRIILISVTEYTLLYLIIGHPNALLIGVLAGLGNLIPVFGGLIVSAIALITAVVSGPQLLIKTIIIVGLTSILDSYVINPMVYKKTNQVPSLLILFSVFAGATLFGFIGVVASIPVTIIAIATYKYYRSEIEQKIEEVKNTSKNL